MGLGYTAARAASAGAALLGAMLAVCACASSSTADERPAAAAAQAQPMTCMPRPSACGFPDATNTGVPAGTQLTPISGNVTLSAPGQVLENKLVTGSITVTAPNVTIRNVKLIATDSYYGIRSFGWQHNTTGLNVVNTEIDLNRHEETKGIAFDNYTAKNVWFHNGLDCAHAGRNVTIIDSYCDLPKLARGSAAHADGFQSDGGGSLVFRHNTIRNPNGQTAAILLSTNTEPISNVVIDHNLMSGGGYTVYCGTDEGGVAPGTTYTNNVISKEFFPKGGYWGSTTWCHRVATARGNIWDGSYVPSTGVGSPGTGVGNPAAGGGTPAGSGPPTAPVAGRLSTSRAKQLARLALARELGSRFTRGAKALRIKCERRSESTVACDVKWRKSHSGQPVGRYSGKVMVTRGAAGDRYRLRMRGWSSTCGCTRKIVRSASL